MGGTQGAFEDQHRCRQGGIIKADSLTARQRLIGQRNISRSDIFRFFFIINDGFADVVEHCRHYFIGIRSLSCKLFGFGHAFGVFFVVGVSTWPQIRLEFIEQFDRSLRLVSHRILGSCYIFHHTDRIVPVSALQWEYGFCSVIREIVGIGLTSLDHLDLEFCGRYCLRCHIARPRLGQVYLHSIRSLGLIRMEFGLLENRRSVRPFLFLAPVLFR